MKNQESMIHWVDVTEATQYFVVHGERIPVTIEGMQYLVKKLDALQMDYNYLVEEIRELEFATRSHQPPSDHTLFMDPY